MSAHNQMMAQLHRERLARLNSNTITVPVAEAQEAPAEAQAEAPQPFECPVCYTDGDSGIVSPKCGHKICLDCYSTILIRTAAETTCPCCRTKYLKTAIPAVQEDPYADMPPLMSQIEMEDLISYNLMTRIVGAQNRVLRAQGLHMINDLINFADNLIPVTLDNYIRINPEVVPLNDIPIQHTMN